MRVLCRLRRLVEMITISLYEYVSTVYVLCSFVVTNVVSLTMLRPMISNSSLLEQGHELTLCVLNRLYREAEQDVDFLSSRTATSLYESFVLTIVCLLKTLVSKLPFLYNMAKPILFLPRPKISVICFRLQTNHLANCSVRYHTYQKVY
jgi:hypothetical protein